MIKTNVDKITVENLMSALKQKNEDITFDELLIDSYEFESYECDYDSNGNCILENAKIVITVYTKDNNKKLNDYYEIIMFTLNLDNVLCDESELDEKLNETIESKIDDSIFQS